MVLCVESSLCVLLRGCCCCSCCSMQRTRESRRRTRQPPASRHKLHASHVTHMSHTCHTHASHVTYMQHTPPHTPGRIAGGRWRCLMQMLSRRWCERGWGLGIGVWGLGLRLGLMLGSCLRCPPAPAPAAACTTLHCCSTRHVHRSKPQNSPIYHNPQPPIPNPPT